MDFAESRLAHGPDCFSITAKRAISGRSLNASATKSVTCGGRSVCQEALTSQSTAFPSRSTSKSASASGSSDSGVKPNHVGSINTKLRLARARNAESAQMRDRTLWCRRLSIKNSFGRNRQRMSTGACLTCLHTSQDSSADSDPKSIQFRWWHLGHVHRSPWKSICRRRSSMRQSSSDSSSCFSQSTLLSASPPCGCLAQYASRYFFHAPLRSS